MNELSKENYNLLKRKALEDKLDNKICIRGAIWQPDWETYEKGDLFFIYKSDNEIQEVPANVQIALAWKDYIFPYKQVSIKPPPESINHVVLVNIPLTRCMVIPKPIQTIAFYERVMLKFDDTTIKSVAALGGEGKLIVRLDKVEFFDL
jgi:hypothetical protein